LDQTRRRTVRAYLYGCLAVVAASTVFNTLTAGQTPTLSMHPSAAQVRAALGMLLVSGAIPLLVAGAVVAWFAPGPGVRHALVFGLLFSAMGVVVMPLVRLLRRQPMTGAEFGATAGIGLVAVLAAVLGGWIAERAKRR
jgi:hypothetical protein